MFSWLTSWFKTSEPIPVGVGIYRYNADGVLNEAIQIKDGRVIYNSNKKGMVDSNLILQLIEKHDMQRMDNYYGDSSRKQIYTEITLSDGKRLWSIHHELGAPLQIGMFIDEVCRLAIDVTTKSHEAYGHE